MSTGPEGGLEQAAGAGEGGAGEAPLRVSRLGRNIGVVLFLVAVAGLVVMSLAGFYPAFYLLVVVIVGGGLVVLGTRMH